MEDNNKLPLVSTNLDECISNQSSDVAGTTKLDHFLGQVQDQQDDDSPQIITPDKLKCYEKYLSLPVIIEGPEQKQDYSFFL